jgi:hypothetical protein
MRRVIDWEPVGNCDHKPVDTRYWTNDCSIVQLLNEPVPKEFTPLKLLPPDASAYFGEFVPCLFPHQSKTFSLVYVVDRPFLAHGCTNVFFPFGMDDRPEWFIPAAGGDSGSSAEYLIDGHLVLKERQSDEIIRAIEALNARHGAKELPERINLSRFPKIR